MVKPFSSVEPDCKHNTPHGPIGKHSDPHCDRSKSLCPAKIDAQAHSEDPHGTGGQNHGKFDISGCTQSIRRDKCRNPDDWFYNRDYRHHIKTHIRTGWFHTCDHCNRLRQSPDDETADDNNHLGQYGKFLDIIHGLFFFTGTDTLTDNGHQTNSNTNCCNTV